MNAPPVQYVTTKDGCSIGYGVSGDGPTLVQIPTLLTDVQASWQLYPEWTEGLSQRFRLVQYDCRGQGFSSRNLPADLDYAAFLLDLEAVVDHLHLSGFLLWGWGSRCHLAIRYALDHPGRVSGLILDLCSVSNDVFERILFTELPKEDWETFLYAVAGRGFSAAEHSQRVDLMRRTMTAEDWDAHGRAQRTSNLEADLPRVGVPTLVMHPRDYPRLSPDHSMKVAALIPGARFQILDGADIHGDPGQGLAAIDAFVHELPSMEEPRTESGSAPDHLSSRELEVLRLLAAGRSNAQIADELVISLNTVRRHVSNVFDKTGAANRAEAAAYATRNGIA